MFHGIMYMRADMSAIGPSHHSWFKWSVVKCNICLVKQTCHSFVFSLDSHRRSSSIWPCTWEEPINTVFGAGPSLMVSWTTIWVGNGGIIWAVNVTECQTIGIQVLCPYHYLNTQHPSCLLPMYQNRSLSHILIEMFLPTYSFSWKSNSFSQETFLDEKSFWNRGLM